MKILWKWVRLRNGRNGDERGATFVLVALSMVMLLWAGAAGVDVGFSVYGSREAQAMADTAALDLARYISYADTLTSISAVQAYLNGKLSQVLTDNGSNATLTVVPGYYNSSTKKFTVNGYTGGSCQPIIAPPVSDPGCNAIEVTASQSVPQIFSGGFNVLSGHAGKTVSGSVSGSSIAVQNPVGGFSIGTYLANLSTNQSAVLNPLLSVLGTSVNLSAASYQGLVTANVTLSQLITASGGLLTSTNILTTQLTAGQWLSIYEDAVGNTYGTSSTAYTSLQALGTFSNGTATDVELCQMAYINVGSTQYGTNCTASNSSISQEGLDASVNVLQMLTTEAELANGTNGVNLTSALNLTSGLGSLVPGLAASNVMLTTSVVSPAAVAYGPVGTVASDAQVQAALSMSLSLAGTSIGTLNVPLSAATGTATLNNMTCDDDSLYTMTILPVNTGAVNTGSSTSGVTLTVAGVPTTEGGLVFSGVSNKSVTFSGPANVAGADIPPSATTASAGTNPESIGSSTPTPTFTAASGANVDVTTTMGVLDPALGPVLQALGLTVGGATVEGISANCGTVSLAQ